MSLPLRPVRIPDTLTLLLCCALTGTPATAARAQPAQPVQSVGNPSWGAIASMQGWYGYSFNHPSRDVAERAAQAQCDRAARRPGTCLVRAQFNRACGALAKGNYGEWATATASTADAASKAATTQCETHLPTEPCEVVVSVCSPR